MTYSSKHLFHIDAPKAKVFKALNTIEGLSNWWTTQTSGDTAVGGKIQFNFGDMPGATMEVKESVENTRVVWEVIESPHGWVGNTIEFNLDENDGKTRMRFSHHGFEAQDDFFAICNFSWGRYMESMRQYIQTGNGEAFGSKGYR